MVCSPRGLSKVRISSNVAVPPTLFLCVVWTSFLFLAPATILHSNTRIKYMYIRMCHIDNLSSCCLARLYSPADSGFINRFN